MSEVVRDLLCDLADSLKTIPSPYERDSLQVRIADAITILHQAESASSKKTPEIEIATPANSLDAKTNLDRVSEQAHASAVMLALCIDAYVQARLGDNTIERLARFEDMIDARKRYMIAARAYEKAKI